MAIRITKTTAFRRAPSSFCAVVSEGFSAYTRFAAVRIVRSGEDEVETE